MKRGLAIASTLLALGTSIPASFAQQAPQTAPWPAATQQTAPWPQAGTQAAPPGAGWPQGPAPQPQSTAVCTKFQPLSEIARKKADAVQAAMKAKVDRKQVCELMTIFVAAEANVVKFLADHKTVCGVPEQALVVSKANHEKSLKFREAACSDSAPHPRAPTLSEAIKTPSVDSATNTKTGRGTFDSLTGNPLAR